MPTASPIIIASVEVVDPRSRTLASAVMVETPMPTPMSAVSSGSPAATSEPKVTTRTRPAMTTPTISPAPVSGIAWSASPPISTVSPADLAASPLFLSASRVSSVNCIALALYDTWTYAIGPWPFLETALALNGSVTLSTWSEPAFRFAMVFSTASLLGLSAIFWPAGALKTMRAVAPSAVAFGKRSLSRSKARCASVPGIENEEEVAVVAEAAPNPARASSATHTRAT